MRQAIFRLTFSTAARFGSDEGGASLAGARATVRSDALFSALFRALLPLGRADALLEYARGGALAFSDGLPWRGEALFLPRPVGLFERPDNPAAEDPSKRKLLKKIAHIPADGLHDFLSGRADLERLYAQNRFGVPFEVTRVNTRDGADPLPYRVGGFRFDRDCGLYVAARGEGDALALLEEGLRYLSAEGIGGKTSSGWGKFSLAVEPVPAALANPMEDADAALQMLLNTALPADDELADALAGACYTVARRGGFATSAQGRPFKKRTVALMGAGSTFRRRFRGQVMDVGAGMPHPVWRCAVPLFMGVNA